MNLSGADLADNVLNVLMPSNGNLMKLNNSSLFPFKRDKVIKLCQEAAKVFIAANEGNGKNSEALVGVRAPAKVFGSIYGRYFDLLKMFENFGLPDDR